MVDELFLRSCRAYFLPFFLLSVFIQLFRLCFVSIFRNGTREG